MPHIGNSAAGHAIRSRQELEKTARFGKQTGLDISVTDKKK
jgi:hypothetical protein